MRAGEDAAGPARRDRRAGRARHLRREPSLEKLLAQRVELLARRQRQSGEVGRIALDVVVRADVARIIELYKRQGRFAATVEPKTVQLSQNRVDLVFEITEGPKSKVRQINIIGNEEFSDGDLKGEMVTKETSLFSFLSGNTSYDPDRLAFDQQKLREFYLTQGYVDFRVVSAVAELTPDKRDFIITYVVEEGERYKFGDVGVESRLRDFDDSAMTTRLPMKTRPTDGRDAHAPSCRKSTRCRPDTWRTNRSRLASSNQTTPLTRSTRRSSPRRCRSPSLSPPSPAAAMRS